METDRCKTRLSVLMLTRVCCPEKGESRHHGAPPDMQDFRLIAPSPGSKAQPVYKGCAYEAGGLVRSGVNR
jgi:hypothetical protein